MAERKVFQEADVCQVGDDANHTHGPERHGGKHSQHQLHTNTGLHGGETTTEKYNAKSTKQMWWQTQEWGLRRGDE